MADRILLVLNGGGALGAYQCGAYKALVRHLSPESLRSMVVVGASIGAVNGYLIAAHHQDPDGGVGALERFWRSVTMPSIPFNPFPAPYAARLNATLTGLTLGNPAIFQAVPGGALGGIFRYPKMAGFDNATLARTVKAHAPARVAKRESGPRLMIRAIDIEAAEPAWFDSQHEDIELSMLGASSAIPLLFKPGEHAGRTYWDGDVWHQGLLPPALDRLKGDGDGDRFHVITMELFTRTPGTQPVGFGGNLDHFRRMFLGARSDEDAAKAQATHPELRLTRIQRHPHPNERVSLWLMDWSAGRLQYLIEQGEADAERALA